MSEPSRREAAAIILTKLAGGALPSVRVSRVWARSGTGSTCDGCDADIAASEVEYEIELAGAVVLRLHPRCFWIWQDLLTRRGKRQAMILAKLAAGALPDVRVSRVWARSGTGNTCDCCDAVITASEVEHEIELADVVVLRLHPRCFWVWQDVLTRRDKP